MKTKQLLSLNFIKYKKIIQRVRYYLNNPGYQDAMEKIADSIIKIEENIREEQKIINSVFRKDCFVLLAITVLSGICVGSLIGLLILNP